MPEAVLLRPEHPLRQAVVAHSAASDGPLEREWLELVQEDERLRVELARVRPPPPTLRQRLMEIPLQARPDSPVFRSRWWIVAVGRRSEREIHDHLDLSLHPRGALIASMLFLRSR